MWAAGEIAAAIYNTNRTSESDHVFTADEFVPKPLEDISQQVDDAEEADMDALKAFFGVAKKS